MALKAGKNVHLTVCGQDLSSYVTKLTMSLKGKALVDVTAMGDSGRTWASDELEDGSFSADFLYDDTATTGPWAALSGTDGRGATAAGTFTVGPQGTATGAPKIHGTCWLEDLPLEAGVGDMIRLGGVPFKIDGACTVATY